MKKRWTALLLALLMMAQAPCAAAVSCGALHRIKAEPEDRLTLRTGPGTKYTELFSLDPARIRDFALLEQEEGGTVYWYMVELRCYKGLYRAYALIYDIDAGGQDVPMADREGVRCRTANVDVGAFAGPGMEYALYDWSVPPMTELTVYHEENGYVLADFVLPGAQEQPYSGDHSLMLTRAWLRIPDIEGYVSLEAQEAP